MSDDAKKEKVPMPRASGTEEAWSVEVRACFDQHPVVHGKQIFTTSWQTLSLEQSSCGVPAGTPTFDTYLMFGLMSYPAAQALRWWFLASLEIVHKDTSVETRLVRHSVRYERTAERVGDFDTVNIIEDSRAARAASAATGASQHE